MAFKDRIKTGLYNINLKTLTARDAKHWSQKAMQIIDSPKIKVVSLDVFDTCLIRSSFYPSDIYCYMNEHRPEEVKFDIVAARKTAEEQLAKGGDKYPNLNAIWEWIRNEYGLTENQMLQLEKAETEAEKKFSHARRCVYEIYQYAVKKGKRVIAVSDMYLNSTTIKELLEHCGYHNFSKIYVSCEYHASKHEGTLYDIVAKEEQISPSEILHIGDYWPSDGWRTRKRGWHSVCIPSAYQYFLCSSGKASTFVNDHFSTWRDRFMLNYILDRCEAYGGLSFRKGTLNLEMFAIACLFPMLYRISEFLLNNREINSNYSRLYFLSRDAWLPMVAYNKIRDYAERGLCAEYLYGSRFIINKENNSAEKNQRIAQYYNDTLELKNGRALIVDIGYSGTICHIADYFQKECKIDKVYLWQFEVNEKRDAQLSTRTYCLFGRLPHYWYIFWEGILTTNRKVGPVLDIEKSHGNYSPICDEEQRNADTQKALSTVQQTALTALESFVKNWNGLVLVKAVDARICVDFTDHYLNTFNPFHLYFLHHIFLKEPFSSLIKRRSLNNFIINMKLNESKIVAGTKSLVYRLLFPQR